MSLLLAPYNSAMRLGQGFNSYTQQVCINDAVVIDPDRINNAATNDDFAMRELCYGIGARAKTARAADEDEYEDNNEEEEEHKLERKDSRGAARELFKRGPNQIVSYSSRAVNKISEIADYMNISSAHSIKYGAIGGSGSFVDFDKFTDSDLNFFISVKVINQSISVEDALVFQGLSTVNSEMFRSVFGDCFISGFLEGGEVNALVSIKVLNKDKLAAVKAEAEIALGVGAAEIKAPADVGIAKSDLSSQTETTVQVGWLGGGDIKPDSLISSPSILSVNAILTKYESLPSYMALKPPGLKSVCYENATIYTNSLLNAYMDYKNIYRTLGTQLFDIENGTKKFVGWPTEAENSTKANTFSLNTGERPFEATIEGLESARHACRFQMVKIVNEVDAIEKHPEYAADEKRPEAIQSTIIFRKRLPAVKDNESVPCADNS